MIVKKNGVKQPPKNGRKYIGHWGELSPYLYGSGFTHFQLVTGVPPFREEKNPWISHAFSVKSAHLAEMLRLLFHLQTRNMVETLGRKKLSLSEHTTQKKTRQLTAEATTRACKVGPKTRYKWSYNTYNWPKING